MSVVSEANAAGTNALRPSAGAASVDRLEIARAAYRDVPLYDPKRSPIEIDLTDNTNLWGIPPTAERVLRESVSSVVTRYPSLYAGDLKAALAEYAGVSPDMIVTGCGSDDVLDSAMRAFANPGERVVSSLPSFAMVPIFARMNDLQWTGVTERTDHSLDVEALLAEPSKVLYVCTPNNPTGCVTPLSVLRELAERCAGVLVIDEAYIEFGGESAVALVTEFPRVLVVRTLSKAFGLAGLRVGYAIGQPSLVLEVEKSRGPYKVNALAEQMAVAALASDMAWVQEHVALAVTLRERLADELRKRGYSPLPSGANFVCAAVPECVAVGQAMRARGVAVRPFPGLPHIGDALRFSVGPWPLLERCLSAFDAAREEVRAGADAVVVTGAEAGQRSDPDAGAVQ
jgi:histidinol-phosphate aminotransferase